MATHTTTSLLLRIQNNRSLRCEMQVSATDLEWMNSTLRNFELVEEIVVKDLGRILSEKEGVLVAEKIMKITFAVVLKPSKNNVLIMDKDAKLERCEIFPYLLKIIVEPIK